MITCMNPESGDMNYEFGEPQPRTPKSLAAYYCELALLKKARVGNGARGPPRLSPGTGTPPRMRERVEMLGSL